jgi:hypothetical protein
VRKKIDELPGSSLPFVGPIEASAVRFGQGDYVRGSANAIAAILDLGMVKSLAVSGGKVAFRAGGALFGSQGEALGYLASRIVPASEAEAATVRLAYESTETTSKGGDLAHKLLGAKGPNQGINYGITRNSSPVVACRRSDVVIENPVTIRAADQSSRSTAAGISYCCLLLPCESANSLKENKVKVEVCGSRIHTELGRLRPRVNTVHSWASALEQSPFLGPFMVR